MNLAARTALTGAFAVAPAALAPGVLLSFDITPKIALVLACAGCAAAFPAPFWRGLRAAWRDRHARWFLILLGVRAAGLVMATAFSQNVGASFAGSRWRQLGLPVELALTILAAAALGYAWGRPDRRGHLVDALAIASIPISVYGILQYFGIEPFLPRALYYAGQEEWAVVRPPSTFGHAGYFATWGAGAALLIWGRAREKGKAWRYVAAALLVAAIVLSGTRGALAGLLLGAFVAGPDWRLLRNKRVWIAAGALAVVTAAFVISPAGVRMRTRAIWSVQDFQGGARPWLWRDSLALGAQRPLVGHGLETFTAEYSRVRSEELAKRYPDQVEESPHNIVLDAWVSQGILGTAALGGLCFLALRRRTAAGAAFVASLAANQFLAFTAMTEAMFLLCAALALAPREARIEADCQPGRAVRAAGVLAGLGFALFAGQLFVAEAEAERARRLLHTGRVDEAAEAFRRAEAVSSRGRSYGDWFARALYGAEAYSPAWAETALGALEAERSESPADAHYLGAALRAEAGRPAAQVEASLRAAVAAAPSWYKPRWKLAQVLHALGRSEEAREWAESADRLAGATHSEVRATWEAVRP